MYRALNRSESFLFVTQEKNKEKIESSPELLCVDQKLEIYQMDNTDEMIITGKCLEGLSSC